ncbi:hypothetical protein PE049_07935 [Limosilactobacillus fermentum]|nr:hypothetical protein [Limosilactobacillus fermentum]WNY94604.1 hypothetical protein PE049_07935 [Limosilactobacillus fermentum]
MKEHEVGLLGLHDLFNALSIGSTALERAVPCLPRVLVPLLSSPASMKKLNWWL